MWHVQLHSPCGEGVDVGVDVGGGGLWEWGVGVVAVGGVEAYPCILVTVLANIRKQTYLAKYVP